MDGEKEVKPVEEKEPKDAVKDFFKALNEDASILLDKEGDDESK